MKGKRNMLGIKVLGVLQTFHVRCYLQMHGTGFSREILFESLFEKKI